MAALRSRRLERLFAARLDSVSHEQVAALVDNQVTEHYDLDFKRGLYGSKDADRRDLAGDVAAMANTAAESSSSAWKKTTRPGPAEPLVSP